MKFVLLTLSTVLALLGIVFNSEKKDTSKGHFKSVSLGGWLIMLVIIVLFVVQILSQKDDDNKDRIQTERIEELVYKAKTDSIKFINDSVIRAQRWIQDKIAKNQQLTLLENARILQNKSLANAESNNEYFRNELLRLRDPMQNIRVSMEFYIPDDQPAVIDYNKQIKSAYPRQDRIFNIKDSELPNGQCRTEEEFAFFLNAIDVNIRAALGEKSHWTTQFKVGISGAYKLINDMSYYDYDIKERYAISAYELDYLPKEKGYTLILFDMYDSKQHVIGKAVSLKDFEGADLYIYLSSLNYLSLKYGLPFTVQLKSLRFQLHDGRQLYIDDLQKIPNNGWVAHIPKEIKWR